MILGGTEGLIKGPYYDSFRKLSGNGLVVNHGESWRKRRKLLTKHFHFSTLSNYVDMFNREINHLIEALQKNMDQCVDVAFYVRNMTFNIINDTLFGNISAITSKESREYLESMATVTEVSLLKALKPHLNVLWPFLKLKKVEDDALKKMDGYISKAIEESCGKHCQNEIDISNMLSLLRSAPLLFDSTAIRNEIDTFIFAGQDTTSTSLSFILMVLANYPKHQETLFKEISNVIGDRRTPTSVDFTSMEFLDRFIKECLRLYPPFIMSQRLLLKELITTTGYRLPAGTIVFVSIFDIQRNPNLYPDPEVFDPDRFLMENVVKRHPFTYIPFSAGPRNCIAQKYAILTIKTSICRILQNFQIEPVTMIDNIEFCIDAMLQVKNGIKVKFRKR
ncbi:hypothetical protein WA026_005838 [Henosepilachna vigintioctopunctata]